MGLDLNAIRLIVYDLDGTVYDDIRHFELYAKEIQSHLPAEARAGFWADYEATVSGRHPALRVGSFYDVQHDLVLLTRAGRVERALHWDGSELPPVVRQHLYPGTVEPDMVRILNVGDLWWVPSAISAHHGGLAENGYKSFLRIRDVMSAPDFEVRSITGLAEVVGSLKGKVVQVLATNSPQPDSEAILAKVGLLGLFDRMFFQSGKPAGLKVIFQELSDQYQLPMSAILSMGDNMVNEIAPARAMGCQTVFIDPHAVGDQEGHATVKVATMTEFLPVLAELARSRS